MLVPLAVQIVAPPSNLVFARAWAASPPAALAALNLAASPAGLAAVAKALMFWLAAALAGLAAWLIQLRQARWRLATDHGEAGATLSEFWSEPGPEPVRVISPEVITPHVPARAQPQGADLAARARFVAMTFAFPERGPSATGPASWPLHLNCEPTRFTLTLLHAALGYRLEFCNRGAEPLGPLMIRTDLVAASGRGARNRQFEPDDEQLPLCHYLDSLPAGDRLELTGELRLPLAGIAAMRLGTAELLVPLMRICAESPSAARNPLRVSACFAIGMPPLSAGGGIQPFRLDSGPGIWRKLTARRLSLADLC